MDENKPEDTTPSCDTCRFWRKGWDECRRFPPLPRITESYTMHAQWPVTEGREWCGEWQPEGRSK